VGGVEQRRDFTEDRARGSDHLDLNIPLEDLYFALNQKIEQAHAELAAALHEHGVHLSEVEASRLREKLAA
jgi:hypothetical protein